MKAGDQPRTVLSIPGTPRFPEPGRGSRSLARVPGDALTNGRWLPDDTPDRFEMVSITFDDTPGDARTVLVLAWRL